MHLPQLIQGGMGVAVSGWRLAREVASLGQLGVVSGTALDTVLIRRLALGDSDGSLRRAINAFPIPAIGQRVLDRYFHFDGVPDADPYGPQRRFPLLPLPRAILSAEREDLLVLANFVEVHLAKAGQPGLVGVNYLHKIQFPLLPSIYGAMLAGVDVVLIGAGIPAEIPAALDAFARGEPASIALETLEASEHKHLLTFDPRRLWAPSAPPPLARPSFVAIVASATLARALLKKAPGGIQGFVVEAPAAGGHNAPPRGALQLTARGEPVYGERDVADLAQMREFNVPFWLAGGFDTPEQFQAAIAAGARGVQVGTAFAFCEESGLDPALRSQLLTAVARGDASVFTDPLASPTSFPFKVAELPASLSDPAVYEARERLCDLGYLRRAFVKHDGTLDYRCPAEPVADYLRKGGCADETLGRKCLCNGLMANIGLAQHRPDDYEEPPLLTAGDALCCLKPRLTPPYHARDVVDALMARAPGASCR